MFSQTNYKASRTQHLLAIQSYTAVTWLLGIDAVQLSAKCQRNQCWRHHSCQLALAAFASSQCRTTALFGERRCQVFQQPGINSRPRPTIWLTSHPAYADPNYFAWPLE